MHVENLLKEQSEYIAALYFIVFVLQKREFERSNNPLGAAIAMATFMREILLNSEANQDHPSHIVVEFFDEVVGDFQSGMRERSDIAYCPPTTKGSA